MPATSPMCTSTSCCWRCIERLKRKPKPLFFLDTHAGRGRYDLQSAGRDARRRMAGRNRALLGHQTLNERPSALPGGDQSPTDRKRSRAIPARRSSRCAALRDGDRIVLVEQQIEEAQALEKSTPRPSRRLGRVRRRLCGAQDLSAAARKSRLVLIDPPYESDDEFVSVRQAPAVRARPLAEWRVRSCGIRSRPTAEAARLHAALRDQVCASCCCSS